MAVVLKVHQNYSENLLKTQIVVSYLQSFWSASLGWVPKFEFMSSWVPGNATAAGPEATLRELLSYGSLILWMRTVYCWKAPGWENPNSCYLLPRLAVSLWASHLLSLGLISLIPKKTSWTRSLVSIFLTLSACFNQLSCFVGTMFWEIISPPPEI